MTKYQIKELIIYCLDAEDVVWLWNDYCDRNSLVDDFLDDNDALDFEEVYKVINLNALVDFLWENKYWEIMPSTFRMEE